MNWLALYNAKMFFDCNIIDVSDVRTHSLLITYRREFRYESLTGFGGMPPKKFLRSVARKWFRTFFRDSSLMWGNAFSELSFHVFHTRQVVIKLTCGVFETGMFHWLIHLGKDTTKKHSERRAHGILYFLSSPGCLIEAETTETQTNKQASTWH